MIFILSENRKHIKGQLAFKLGNVTIKKTLDFMGPFYGWCSTVSTELHKSPGGPGTHFIDLREMKLVQRPCSICSLKTKNI